MSFKVTQGCELEFLSALEKYFLKDREGESKIYFSGEYDSNQSKFEQASNHLKIGVIAPSEAEGLVLLRLVRILVDENYALLMIDLCTNWVERDGEEVEVDYMGKVLSMERVVKRLAKKEKTYMACFKLDEPLTTKLYGYANGANYKTKIMKKVKDVDTWDLSRVMNEIKKCY
jgi:hypothetical protein